MTLTRRLLVPLMLFFAILLVGLVGLRSAYDATNLRTTEIQQINELQQAFLARVQSMENFTQALAIEVASNPDVQKAFAEGDREQLLALTQPAYQQLNETYHLTQFQFISSPATAFLDLQAPERYGDELAGFRPTLLAAGSGGKPVSGLEIARSGLGVYGVAPVTYNGQLVGTVEFGVPVDGALFSQLKQELHADWQVLLRNGPATVITAPGAGLNAAVPNTDLVLQSSSLENPVFIGSSEYTQALSGQPAISKLTLPAADGNAHEYSVLSAPLVDFSGNIIGVMDILRDRSDILAEQNNMASTVLVATLISLTLAILGFYLITRRTLEPLHNLSQAAARLAAGQLDESIPVDGTGDIGSLAASLNGLASQLRLLVDKLDERVSERTREVEKRSLQLQAASDIASQIAAPHNLDDLLNQAVNLIRQRFNYYHIGIFLLDDQAEYAVLKAANGDPGKLLVQTGHKLKVGAGIVGYVAAKGEARISADVTRDSTHYRNPILPYTRSEMALPLKAGGRIIGALDVQSTDSDAFAPEDTTILQTLADQLAVAIQNARLVEQLESTVQETNLLYQKQIEDAWQHFTSQQRQTGFVYDRVQIIPDETELPQAVYEQLRAGAPVVIANQELLKNDSIQEASGSTLLVPLTLREQMIGVIGIAHDEADYSWAEDEIAIAQAAANQASLTLENARLLEETRMQAERERLAGEITAKMRASNDPQTIIQTAITELRSALRAHRAQVLVPDGAVPPSQAISSVPSLRGSALTKQKRQDTAQD